MYSRISWHKHVSCAFSRLPFSLLNGRVAKPPRGRAHAHHPRTTFSFLLPTPYSGCPLHSGHALPSPFFSLLPTLEAHCIVTTHLPLLSSPYSLLVVLSFSMDARRNRRAGAPKRAIHALPSPFFSLLPTLEAHCIVTTHYLLLSSPYSSFSLLYVFISFYKNFAVTLSGARFTSSREPRATIRPPASPPPGPMSMM